MGFIPDDVIETIRLRSNIVDVISRYVRLTKKGRNYTGLCPFHQERAPSFTVTPDKQMFYCYGCNVGGDVFKFLMLKDNLTFVEAVTVLANQTGVSIPETDSPAEAARQQKSKLLRQINGLARDFYCHVLLESDIAAPARNYLTGRGISQAVLEQFQIGYAPPGWNHLTDFMKSHRIQPQIVAEAGLAQMKDGGNCYDRFRGRVIFPIWDIAGQVIAFGGRVLDDAMPKYLNSPETALFTKGRNLYGLHLAGKTVKEKGYLIIMEGYMDVVTAHSFGLTNAVASLGTSLTREQGYLLINHSKDVVLAYDADQAGVAAALRSIELLQEIGCHARVLRIPDGKDPDGFLRQHGAAAWEGLIKDSLPAIEFVLWQSTENKTISTISEKLAVIQNVFPYIARVKTEVEREEGLKTISRILGLSPEAVRAEFDKFTKSSQKSRIGPESVHVSSRVSKPPLAGERGSSRDKAEEGLIRLVLEDPSRGEAVIKDLGSSPFRDKTVSKLFSRVLTEAKRFANQPAELLNNLEEDEQALLSRIMVDDVAIQDPAQWLSGYIVSIKRENRRERREEIIKEISEAEKRGDQVSYGHLWREYTILRGIAEAERTGDLAQAESLLKEYQRHNEGSESAARRS